MQAVKEKSAIGIIGLGYVGLKELVTFASANETVIGYDINIEKIDTLQSGKSPIGTVSDKEIKEALTIGCKFTDDFWQLKNCKFVIIAVPTPLGENKDPDIKYIESAFKTIKKFFDRNKQTIILESTTYPGCSREMVDKYFPGEAINYAFCGEREDPGGKCSFDKIPRVLGASSKGTSLKCKEL
jgi:UDP-N-acetyl-D-glucosamine dehydrogenase